MANKILYALKHPERIYIALSDRGFFNWVSDKTHLKVMYKCSFGKKLNLKNPKTYNEKLNWIKLYDRNPLYTKMVDKYEVKKYVADRIGEEYIIPTLGIWDSFDEIDFDKLPDQFVLKCTHDSGGLVICTDKNKLDKSAAKNKIEKSLKRDFYKKSREWPYKNVKPRIIAEKYMTDTKTGELRDYKIFAFNGETKMLFIATDRQSEDKPTAFDFFDMDYNYLDMRHGHPNAPILPEKPQNFEEMKALADKLSEGIPHVRVDFYEIDGKTYFGELTFFHHGGLLPFDPESWDEIMGEWINLPEQSKKGVKK